MKPLNCADQVEQSAITMSSLRGLKECISYEAETQASHNQFIKFSQKKKGAQWQFRKKAFNWGMKFEQPLLRKILRFVQCT